MHPRSHAHAGDSAIEQAAGEWLARLDRGLAPEEAVEFAEWEAADPRHRVQLERLKATWRALDTADEVPEIMRLVQEMEQSQRQRARWRRPKIALVGLGMAAALTLAWIGWSRLGRASATFARSENRAYQIVPSSGQRLTLVDGTVVEFSADSAVEPAFTAQERRVRLVRGEAHFSVVRDAARPFIVQAGTVAVRAVGTAFNVRLDPATVEVLVTEGKVRVDDAVKGESLLARKSPGATPTTPEPPVLWAGERVPRS